MDTDRNIVQAGCMKKKRKIDTYVGGERDAWNVILPKDLSQFFNKERILLIFVVFVVMLLLAGVTV